MKIAVIILFLISVALASDNKDTIKAKILEKIFTNISTTVKLTLWSDNQNLLDKLKENGNFTTSLSCKDATIIILEKKDTLDKACKDKATFVLEYNLLTEIPQSIGALFWKKGRPNIIIISPRAKKHSIEISENLNEYVEERVW